MADYVKTTTFAAKADTDNIVGIDFDVEFDNIAARSADKADKESPALTGTATAVDLTVSGTLNANSVFQIGGVEVTSTAAELNKLDGVTATTTELNYVDGVTSNIQTQLNDKAPIADPAFTGTVTSSGSIVSSSSILFENDSLAVDNQFKTGVLDATSPILVFDDTDYIQYDRTNNLYRFRVGAQALFDLGPSATTNPFILRESVGLATMMVINPKSRMALVNTTDNNETLYLEPGRGGNANAVWSNDLTKSFIVGNLNAGSSGNVSIEAKGSGNIFLSPNIGETVVNSELTADQFKNDPAAPGAGFYYRTNLTTGTVIDANDNVGISGNQLLISADRWILKSAGSIALEVEHDGLNSTIILKDLPTADPTVAGQLWNDSGTLKVSAG